MNKGDYEAMEKEFDDVLGLLLIACREECCNGGPIMVHPHTLTTLINDRRRLRDACEWASEFVECLYTEKKILRGPWCRSGMECVENLRSACQPAPKEEPDVLSR